MHRKLYPKPILLLVSSLFLLTTMTLSQIKPEGELVVSKCWSYSLSSGRALISDGFRVYLTTSDARIEAVSIDGKKLWETELGGEIVSNLAVNNSGVFIVTSTPAGNETRASASLKALSRETGITGWSFALGDAVEHTLTASESFLTVVSANGIIRSVDGATGNVRWKREVAQGFIGKPYVGSERLLVSSTSNQLFVISAASGEIQSVNKPVFPATAVSETKGGEVVIGDERGGVTIYWKATEGPGWRFKSGGGISSVRAVNGNILAASNDNYVYFLRPRSGGLDWKKRLAGRITHIGVINNKLALVSSLDEHGATFLNLSTGKVIGQIGLEDGESLTSDPVVAGNLILVMTTERVIAYSLNGCP